MQSIDAARALPVRDVHALAEQRADEYNLTVLCEFFERGEILCFHFVVYHFPDLTVDDYPTLQSFLFELIHN